jgi:hypothetical protein
MLLRGGIECVGRRRGSRRVSLNELGQIFVLILVALVVDETENPVDGLGVEQNGNGSLTVDEQSAVQTRGGQVG